MAPRPLDQNGLPQQSSNAQHPAPTHTTPSNPLATPSVVNAGEYMLIISLVLILLVVITVTVHFLLERQKRRRRKTLPKKGKNSDAQPELQSKEKKFAELVGTPLCEMGDSEPRHEMEDAEVLERHTLVEPEHPQDNPVYLVSPLTPNYDAGIMFGDMSTRTTTEPDAGVYALYHAR
ncbi:hypothetical protein BU23DRAFT_43444 [Bimuria novae-zelandiae CBS 107.79]|uniref:Uncharacterized protein n=1 Tax=Bimuria novae-zelandiae CBS 107.79 TaxID=1447943 RepID=A0A6A5VGB1_9PLEO|nr:hypothetical protein BU23DRAFT_43444 [Bimuria novae-zelandiae CBS 107.79]